MQDVRVETEVLTLPLRFAMVASRAAAALRGVRLGKPLDEKGRHTLRVLSGLMVRAEQGGKVLRDKSMASYSAEAMSAYRLVQDTKLPGVDRCDHGAVVKKLRQIATDLRGLAENKPTKLNSEILQEFTESLTRQSLNESAGRQEEALQLG
jgi:hypothetical protein